MYKAMKKVIIAVLFLLVLAACINKTEEEKPTGGEVAKGPKTYTFNFVVDRGVPSGLEGLFVEKIKKRVGIYGYDQAEVNLSEGDKLEIVITDKTGIIFLEGEFEKYMLNAPYFEIRAEEIPEKLALTDEEKQEIVDYNNNALAKADDLLAQILENPNSFADLAREHSEDPGSKDNGGAYAGITKGVFVAEYEDVIFNKLEVGEIYNEVVETSFGYHVIKKDGETGEGDERTIDTSHILISKRTEGQALTVKQWLETGLTGLYIEVARGVQQDETKFAYQITFDEAGRQLLAEVTKNNIDRRVAVFIDGLAIGAPTITQEITDGRLVITGDYTQDQVIAIAQRLSSGTIHSSLSLAE